MNAAKSFKTVIEQLDILESRGLLIDNRDAAARFLLRNNYYSVVNGYKEFLLDPNRTNKDIEMFKDGSTFLELRSLYGFDAILRFSMMHCLTVAEQALKTATVHAFCKKFQGADDYLDPSSYCPRKLYDGKNYTSNLIGLLSTLQKVSSGKGASLPYIKHYTDKHKPVPLWVAANALTFGNMSHFYDLQRIEVQNETCHLLCESIGSKSISAKRLKGIYSTLTTFRNICAHGGRLFCATAGRRGDKMFGDMLIDLSIISTESEIKFAIRAVVRDLKTIDPIPELRPLVEEKMGIKKPEVASLIEKYQEN